MNNVEQYRNKSGLKISLQICNPIDGGGASCVRLYY